MRAILRAMTLPLLAALVLHPRVTRANGESEEARWLTLHLDQAGTGVYVEGYQEDAKFGDNTTVRERRLFVGPLIDLKLSGSVYHPNLFSYQLATDGSVGWTKREFTGANPHSENQYGYLGSFVGSAQIFDHKPFNGNVFGSYAHTYQDYDFFNRIYLDNARYGGGVRWTGGGLTLAGTAWHETEDATGYGTPTVTERTVASFDATDNRPSGSSGLNYTFTRYNRNDFGTIGFGQDHSVSATDSEEFGNRKQIHSVVNVSYNHLDNLAEPSDLYNATGSLTVDHSDILRSRYSLTYQRNTYDGVASDNLNGNAALQHRLYKSLVSELGVQGYRSSASGGLAQQDTWQLGGGPAFQYTKKLGALGTVTASENLLLLHTDVKSTGGVVPVIDEAHTFGTSGNGAPPDSFFLRQPRVIASTILITDASHQPPQGYIPGLDYDIIPNGELTVIRRRAGSRMPASVLVTYNFDASPSGSYDTLNNSAGVRFDFFENLWGVYGRVNTIRNFGAENLLVQNLDDFVVGTDVTWRFLRAGIEYEVYDSSLSPFTAVRVFQSFTFRPDDYSTLSFNFNQAFIRYEQPVREEQDYTGIARYSYQLTRHWGLTLEGGVTERVGVGVDQTLGVFRPAVQYTAGKLTASAGYDFGYDEYLRTEKRIRNMAYLRVRRVF